ncbi:MAG: hypothetical protein WAU61_12155, partial [Smithella sp.]
MKSTVCWKKVLFSVAAIFFLTLFITACNSGNGSPPPAQWETLITLPDDSSFSDFTPLGQSVLYVGAEGGSFYQYEFPTAANAQGILSSLATPTSFQYYIGFAWSGSYLYFAQVNSVYKYDISGNSWTTPVTGLTYDHESSESTADDSGYFYSLSYNYGNPFLLKYNTANNTYEYYSAPADILIGDEPRLAWDSQTQRVYLGDYEGLNFYAFNPTDDSFTALAPFPDANGMSDAFCSDRRGHIYTAISSSSSTATDVWVYTEATDSWSQFSPSLPFAHGDNAACTI